MKSFRNQFVSAFVIFSSIVQAPLLTHAQVIEDLPNLEAGESLPQTEFLSSIEIKGLSQKASGTLYVVDLKKALSLARVDLKVSKSRIRLYSVTLVTDNSTRVIVQNLTETDVARGATVSSESLNQSNRVTAIEILAESAEAAADLSVLVVADREKAELKLREAKAPKVPEKTPEVPVEKPQVPAVPKAPDVPKKPVAPKVPEQKAPVQKAPKVETPKVVPAPKVVKAPNADRKVTNQNRLSKGIQVMVPSRDYSKATVVSVQADGTYTIKFITGELTGKTGGSWGRSSLAMLTGCTADFCVGDEVFNTERDTAKVRVVAVQDDGSHVLLFLDGELSGKTGSDWATKNLSTPKKCGNDFCVGEKAYLFDEDRTPARVQILATQQGGEKYVVYFTEGTLAGKRGSNWGSDKLAKLKGCGTTYCVGDVLLNIKRNSRVLVVGIQKDGDYLLQFQSGDLQGKVGHNWDDADLRRIKK